MGYFLRALHRADDWAEVEDAPEWHNNDCPARLLRSFHASKDELSVYFLRDKEANGSASMKRIVAAHALTKNGLDSLCFGAISEDDVRNLGGIVVADLGNTKDSFANERHRNIRNISGKFLVNIAIVMWKNKAYENYNKIDVGEAIVDSVKNSFIRRKDVREKFVHGLWKSELL